MIVTMIYGTTKPRTTWHKHPVWRKHSSFSNPSFNPQMISGTKCTQISYKNN